MTKGRLARILAGKLSGIVTLHGRRYLFRDDHGFGTGIWAWEIRGEIGARVMTHKWQKMPKEAILELFDLDSPPRTVSYQPLLG